MTPGDAETLARAAVKWTEMRLLRETGAATRYGFKAPADIKRAEERAKRGLIAAQTRLGVTLFDFSICPAT